jgi:hypothetical protein
VPPPTPGDDPIQLRTPVAHTAEQAATTAALSGGVGPHRTPRSSPSPSPYGSGFETPRAPWMSSASTQAARQTGSSPTAATPTRSSHPSCKGSEDPFSIPRFRGRGVDKVGAGWIVDRHPQLYWFR